MPVISRRPWSRDELVVAFYHYCRIPFGKLHRLNPEIISLSKVLDRTPSAVAMKLSNFASFDPAHRQRSVVGLKNTSKADREIWEQFHNDWESLIIESSDIVDNLGDAKGTKLTQRMSQATETKAERRVRLVQAFFRETVLASYDSNCGICSLEIAELLVASHIIPWSADKGRRADPTNGLCLCVFHDKAFDKGLFCLDPSLRIKLSKRVHKSRTSVLVKFGLTDFENHRLILPQRFAPDPDCLAYHRLNVFQA
ncbi:MAG: HNH endonuclease [candidate division Zixibacteria bacterium]|nr:HNH endonuclease [candidate division Zixibacteria bacterium]